MKSCRKVAGNFNSKKHHLKFNLLMVVLSLTLFLVMVLMPSISAIEVSMDSKFSQGETLLAKFSGNFIDQIRDENVLFYRGHVKIPIVYDVVKIEEEFYVYALLAGKTEGNYSLSIEGVRYMKGTDIVDDDIVSNFSISNETAVFSVNPGVLITTNDFPVEFQNLQDRKITININENSPSIDSQKSLELKSGEKKKVFFSVEENPVKGIVSVEFSSGDFSYILPAYIDSGITDEEKEKKLEFHPQSATVSLATNSDAKRIIYIENTGEEILEDILFDVSPLLEPYVEIFPDKINKLEPNETEKIEIQISSDAQEKIIEGDVIAFTENFSASFTLVLDFVKDFVPANGSEPLIVTSCEDLGGIVCTEGLECSGDIVQSKNGDCCIAPLVCQEPKKPSSGKYIGWGLLILAFVFLFWFYKRRYKRVAKRKAF